MLSQICDLPAIIVVCVSHMHVWSQICDLPAAIVVYVLPHAQVGMGPHMKEGVKA